MAVVRLAVFLALFSAALPLTSEAAGKVEELAEQARDFAAAGQDAKAFYALQELERTDAALFRANNFPYLAGFVAARAGQTVAAERYFAVALQSLELSDYAVRGLAELEKARGHLEKQREYLDRLVERRSQVLAVDAALQRALSFMEEGVYEKALSALADTTLSGRDTLPERVRCLMVLGRRDEARRLVATTLRARRRPEGLMKALGMIELEEDDREIERLGNDELLLRADLYSQYRNFPRALFYYKLLHDERQVRTEKVVYAIGRSLDGSGRKAEALDWFSAIEGALGPPYKHWATYSQGEILFKRQEFARAEEIYRRALATAPNSQQDLSVRLRILVCQLLSGHRDRVAATVNEIIERHRVTARQMKFLTIKDLVAEGKLTGAVEVLDALAAKEPSSTRPELLFWKGMLLEQQGNLGEAASVYDTLLRSFPTSFHAILAEIRLGRPSLAALPTDSEAAINRARALADAGKLEEARRELSYLFHRYPARSSTVSATLRDLYSRLAKYRDIASLQVIPSRETILSLASSPPRTRAGELAYLGFYGDAARELDAARDRKKISPSTLLTVADWYQRGGMSYMAMLRAESIQSLVPRGYEFTLLPRRMQELLYPLNFTTIVDKSAPADLDLALFFAVMREESRFNPRARSIAGARGLLQFLPGTAVAVLMEMGRGGSLGDDDLYDPSLSITLGAYYIAKLARQYDGEPAPVLASYNAGEEQGKLWLRLAGSAELHRYLAEVNYPETRNYIMRIMTGYHRYRTLYPELSRPAAEAARASLASGR